MRRLLIFILMTFSAISVQADDRRADHVIIISFDGLRPDAIEALGPKGAPHFYDLINGGAYTFNARSDADWTVTMPNHTCMLTGLGVEGRLGHNYTDNKSTGLSIHQSKGRYLPSIFDAAKGYRLTTGLFASKLKFQVFINSYKTHLDVSSVTDQDDALTLKRFVDQAGRDLPNLTFIHFSEPDHTGHRRQWSIKKNSAYLKAVQGDDRKLGKIINLIRQNPAYEKSTVIMITSDHGGSGLNHGNSKLREDYRVPFIIWGKGVAAGSDLYTINQGIRKDPQERQVTYAEVLQPIRNGDVGNGALAVLGVPPLRGSTIGNPMPIRAAPVN